MPVSETDEAPLVIFYTAAEYDAVMAARDKRGFFYESTRVCHFCGTWLTDDRYEVRRTYNYFKLRWDWLLRRHYVKDCRPDLIEEYNL